MTSRAERIVAGRGDAGAIIDAGARFTRLRTEASAAALADEIGDLL